MADQAPESAPRLESVIETALYVDDLPRAREHLGRALEVRKAVLPAGHPGAAALHLARTVIRRAERLMVELADTAQEPVGKPALKYVNRASDLLFVAARIANDDGRSDVLWVPGGSR